MQEGFIPAERMVTDVPEFQEYRLLSEKAQEAVRLYNGAEDSYNKITGLLIQLEKKALSLKLAPTLPIQDQERITANILLPLVDGEKYDVGSLLDVATAADSVRRVIRQALHGGRDAHEVSPLYIRRVAGILLPPAEHPRVQHGAGKFEATRFEDRLFELTRILERGNVFLDDCIATIGLRYPSQMRQLSYALVEIPRIDRSVLICDQVGEATFVIHGLGDPDRYLTMTKEQLQTELGANVRRVIRHTWQQWDAELGALLFTEEAWQQITQEEQHRIPRVTPPRHKIGVARFVEVRDAIFTSQYNTLESWIQMTRNDATTFRPLGFTLSVIGRSLGVQGDACRQKIARLECARAFFGDNPILAQEIERRKSTNPAPPGWMSRSSLYTELGISSSFFENLIQPHLAAHPEWEKEYLDKAGKPVNHLAPELCDLIRKERAVFEKAPPGWMSRNSLCEELEIGYTALENHILPHLSRHPEWEKEYLDKAGKPVNHLAPELCDLIRQEGASFEKVPPGWMSRGSLGKKLGISFKLSENLIKQHLAVHPEWEKEYLNEQGRSFFYLAPELCDLIRQERAAFEKAPPGWMSRNSFYNELGISARFFENLIKPHLAAHPEREKKYLDKTGKLVNHLAPELCDLIRQERAALEKAPPGWMIRKPFARELGISFRTLENLIQPHLAVHPEWEKEHLKEQGRSFFYLAPELCELVRRERKF